MRCKTCHYSLTCLAEHRCPECGRDFDPNDPSTFETPVTIRRQNDRVMILIVIGLSVAFLVVVAIVSRGLRTFGFD